MRAEFQTNSSDLMQQTNGGTLPAGKLKPVKLSPRGNPMDAFKPKYRNTTLLLYLAFSCCVFGYYGISFISVKFFSLGGEEGAEPWKQNKLYWESLIGGSAEIPSLFVGVWLIDRIGRKKTMLVAFAIFSLSSFALVAQQVQDIEALGVVMVFLSRMNVSLAFMTLYIYFSEYYPTTIRSTALGMASSLGRIAGMATGFVSEDLSFSLGILLYAISGAVAFVCVVFVKDTMGRAMTTSVAELPEWMKDNKRQSVDVGLHDSYGQSFEMTLSNKQRVNKGRETLRSDSEEDAVDDDQNGQLKQD